MRSVVFYRVKLSGMIDRQVDEKQVAYSTEPEYYRPGTVSSLASKVLDTGNMEILGGGDFKYYVALSKRIMDLSVGDILLSPSDGSEWDITEISPAKNSFYKVEMINHEKKEKRILRSITGAISVAIKKEGGEK